MKRRGATLISAIVGIALLATTVAAAIHIYALAGVAADVASSRSLALMAAETRLESMQARQYAELPAPGTYPISRETLAGIPNASGNVEVSAGPTASSKQVTVRIQWIQHPGRQTSSLTLSRVFAQGGMSS